MERVPTGVEGLDEMLGGGFPLNHIIVLIGEFGTGKSTFALQYIYEGLNRGEPGIFISLEEDVNDIVSIAEENGWDLKSYLDKKSLLVFNLSASDIKTSIMRVESELPSLIRSFGAKRLVIDSVTLLEMLFEHEADQRKHLLNLCRMVKGSGATSLFTSECDKQNPFHSRFGLIEYIADGVISLRYVRSNSSTDVTLALEIVKMRRSWHSRKITPYEITERGIMIHAGAEVFI
ncbi:MAG: KaiC domain-containing protein [Candidatus Syntropharchaeia archaeon]